LGLFTDGPPPPEMFTDTFERGNLAGWAGVVGG
jgi:hypothetical protein